MRASLRLIDPNDYPGWEAFASAEIPEPWDHFEWFTLNIGPEGDPGSDFFQVCVATPAAVGRVPKVRGRFRGLVVDSFEAETVSAKLHGFVWAIQGATWLEIVDQLRRVMLWEYEGRGGA